MRPFAPWLLVLPCLFTGCLELEHTVTLAAAGSGRQSVRLAMRQTTLQDLERTAAAAQTGGAIDPKAVFDKALVERELAAAGLTLGRHVATNDGGRRTVELEASFPTFAALQQSPLCGSAASWELTAGPKAGTAKLTLYPQGQAAWQEARQKAEAMGAALDPIAAEFFRRKQEQLAGLDVTVRFQLPGDVLVWTANMAKTGDREVTARITAEQIKTPSDLVRRLAPRFEVIFDATGCSLPLGSSAATAEPAPEAPAPVR
jgi:hypothetical protein